MVGPPINPPAAGRENRLLPRLAVSFTAQLVLPGGARAARIVDLHARGARLEMSSPPGVGAAALLKWETNECFCTVVWVEGSECGLAFELGVSPELCANFNLGTPARTLPVAAIDNIQAGVKRTPKFYSPG